MMVRCNKTKKGFRIIGVLLIAFLVSCSEKTNAETTVNSALKAADSSELITDSTNKVTFIELGSVGCVPCQAMVPVMDAMKEELADQVAVVFHDVWTEEGQPYGQEYGIRVIPTQIFLDKNGTEYYRHEGYFAKEAVYAILEEGGVELK